MSSLYGADAVGGVINIITKQATSDTRKINLGLRYGQNKDGDGANKNISLDLKSKIKKFKYSIYINKNTTDSYTQKQNANVLVKAPKTLNPSNGNKTYQKVKPSMLQTPTKPDGSALPNNANTAPLLNAINYLKGNLSDSYNNQDVSYREDSDVLSYGARVDYAISDATTIGFEVNAFDEQRDGMYVGYFHPSKFKMPVYNIPVNSKDENNRLDVGIDLNTNINEDLTLKIKAYKSFYEKRNTTTAKYWKDMGYANEGESASNGMDADVDIRSYEALINYFLNEQHLLTAGIEKRDEKRDSTVFDISPNMSTKKVNYKAAYIQDEYEISNTLNAIIGVRYDEISNADNKTTFRLGIVKNINKAINIRMNYAQAYRTPDIREMYINKDTPNGKQRGAEVMGYDLKPELTNSYEIGLNGRINGYRYNSAIFLNEIDDRIQDNVVKAGGIKTFENIKKAQTKGYEISVKKDISKNLLLGFNCTRLFTEDKTTNKDLVFVPKRVVSLNFDYNVNKQVNLGLNAKHIGEQKTSTYTTTNKINTLDLSARYNINKNNEVYLGIDNINDEKIDDVLGSSVGRYYYLGYRASF